MRAVVRTCEPCSVFYFVVPLVLQVGEMIKDREAVVHGGMTGKGLKVRSVCVLKFRCAANFQAVWVSNSVGTVEGGGSRLNEVSKNCPVLFSSEGRVMIAPKRCNFSCRFETLLRLSHEFGLQSCPTAHT